MGIGANGDDITIKLSMDIDDLQKDLQKLKTQVSKSMDDIQQSFSGSTKGLDKISDAVYDLKNDVNKNFDKIENKARDTSNDMSKRMNKGFSSIISSAKKMGSALAMAFSVREIFQFGKSVIESTAELDALEAQFEQVMKGMESEANKSLDRMSKEFGMLPNRLKGNLSAFTSQFKGLGLGDLEALEEAEAALTLSADAAAFFDMSVEEATEHVRSFIKGNYIGGESVQLFGSETMIAAWAADNMGSELKALGGKWKNLDEKSKQYFRMRYAEKMYEEAGVTGQANREMDMYANVIGNAKQAWTDFKAVLGDKILEKVNGVLADFSERLRTIGESDALEFVTNNLADFSEKVINLVSGIVNWLGEVDWQLVGMQIGTITDSISEFANTLWDTTKEAFKPVGDLLSDIWTALTESEDVNTDNMDAINKVLLAIKPVFEWFADNGEAVSNGLVAVAKGLLVYKSAKAICTGIDTLVGTSGEGGKKGTGLKGLMTVLEGIGLSKASSNVGKLAGKLSKISKIALPSTAVAAGFIMLYEYGKEEGWYENSSTRHDKDLDRIKGNKGQAKKNRKTIKGAIEGNVEDSSKRLETAGGDTSKNLENIKKTWTKFENWLWGDDENKGKGSRLDNINKELSESDGKIKSWGDIKGEIGQIRDALADTWNGVVKFCDEHDLGTKLKKWLFPSLTDGEGNKVTFFGELDKIADDLSRWSREKLSPFLEGVKKDTDKLWDDINLSGINSWSDFVKQVWNPIENWLNSVGGRLLTLFGIPCDSFSQGWTDFCDRGLSALQIGLNRIIGAINGLFQALGINKQIGSITFGKSKKKGTNKSRGGHLDVDAFAKGTNNAGGGLSLVGEAGREIVSDPKLGTFIANSATLLNLSKGASVLSNKNTEKLLKSFGIKAYAKGKNEGSFWGNVWDYVKNPSKAIEKILGGGIIGSGELISGLNTWFTGNLKDIILDFIENIFNSDEVLNHVDNPDNKFAGTGAGFGTAMTWARQALSIAGYKPMMQAYKDFMTAFKIVGRYESNYNNSAMNNWDSNAKKGTPSGGWLQFIKPTFMANAFKGYTNWGNGMHQALAFINYANRRYGSPLNVPGVKSVLAGGKYRPYANGGLITNPTMALMGEAGQEAVVPLSNAKALKPFGQSVLNAIQEEANGVSNGTVYEFSIPVVVDGKEIARATAVYTQEELDKQKKRANRLRGMK